MNTDDSSNMYFYRDPIKVLFWFIIILIINLLVCLFAFIGEYTTVVAVSAFIAFLLFIFICFVFNKGVQHPNPYLTLTDDALIITSVTGNKTKTIEWDDISRFNARKMEFRMFIEIVQFKDEMRRNEVIHGKNVYLTTKYAIVWNLIKREDRQKLAYELDRRIRYSSRLVDKLIPLSKAEKRNKQESSRRIDEKYMRKAYIISLALSVLAVLLYSWSDSESISMSYIVMSFMLYPFAKILYDVVLGFKISEELEDHPGFGPLYLEMFILIGHYIMYMFSILLGPLGILFLIGRAVYRKWKKK